jgi:hypothetical protein
VFPHEVRHQGRKEQWRVLHRTLAGTDAHESHQAGSSKKTMGCMNFYSQEKTAIIIRGEIMDAE